MRMSRKLGGYTLNLLKPILVLAIIFSALLLVFVKPQIKQETKTTIDVRKIAWNSLSNSERKEVIGNWEDAAVSKVIADKKRFGLVDLSYEGKEVTMVTFQSIRSALLGNISILVDEKSKEVIGGGLRD
jgi:hypothetical protein